MRARKWYGATKMISYTSADNHASANNLIRSGYLLYEPENAWAGPEFLYWYKPLV